MTAPNIVDVQAIKGLTSVANFLTTSANTIVENPASSNNVIKLNDIVISNIDGTANADVTVIFNRQGNTYHICKNITVPADASFNLVTKEWAMYLEEGDSITAYASANGDLAISASYEIISEQSISANSVSIENEIITYLTARYIKWEITGKVSNSTVYCQISEFKLQLDSVDVSMSGATASSSDSYVAGETPTQLIDGSTTTKLNFNTLPTVSVTIDMGTATNFNGYDWATGGDTATFPERNPDDWNIYISNDGTNWTLVDTVTNASALTTNQTFTGPYTIAVS